jgi:hypothetical protein
MEMSDLTVGVSVFAGHTVGFQPEYSIIVLPTFVDDVTEVETDLNGGQCTINARVIYPIMTNKTVPIAVITSNFFFIQEYVMMKVL